MNKRETSNLTPYFEKDGEFHFFLQMRSVDATNYPNMFGLFGGGLEQGEAPEQAMVREIKEELEIEVPQAIFFSRFEFSRSIEYAFYLEVREEFEKRVRVREGQYGKFLSEKEMRDNPLVVETTRLILMQLAEYLRTAN